MSRQTTGLASKVLYAATFLTFLALVVYTGLAGTYTRIWDGGFPFVACQLTFVDNNGAPIQGVTLRVERPNGTVAHHRPIGDFYPGRVPTSDASGTLQFRCCGHKFGGTCHTYFYVIERGGCDGPDYTCRFFYRGREIHSIPFDDLAFPENPGVFPRKKRSLAIPKVEQRYTRSIPPRSELPEREYEFMVVHRTVVVDVPVKGSK